MHQASEVRLGLLICQSFSFCYSNNFYSMRDKKTNKKYLNQSVWGDKTRRLGWPWCFWLDKHRRVTPAGLWAWGCRQQAAGHPGRGPGKVGTPRAGSVFPSASRGVSSTAAGTLLLRAEHVGSTSLRKRLALGYLRAILAVSDEAQVSQSPCKKESTSDWRQQASKCKPHDDEFSHYHRGPQKTLKTILSSGKSSSVK